MVGPRDVAVSVLALTGPGFVSAFRCPQLNKLIQDHVGMRHSTTAPAAPSSYRRSRAARALSMVSEREEELKDKIAKLRGAASKGESYERVVGDGKDLTEKMDKSKGAFDATVCDEGTGIAVYSVQLRGTVWQRETYVRCRDPASAGAWPFSDCNNWLFVFELLNF